MEGSKAFVDGTKIKRMKFPVNFKPFLVSISISPLACIAALNVCVCVCVCAHTRVLLEQDHRGPWTREGVNVLRLEGLPGVESS